MVTCDQPIGFMDSGLGGLSVLKETMKILPKENYIYYGDSMHAPYGTKTLEEVRALTMYNVEFLLELNVKAVVIACNTATSAAVNIIREKYRDIPIIGVEPALKPAVELSAGGNIIIMATNMTLHEEKFHSLMMLHKEEANIIPLPCPGLMDFVERGELSSQELTTYLYEKLEPYLKDGIDAIVLGCTHYPFVKPVIRKIVGDKTNILDGSLGTANELKRQLLKKNLLTNRYEDGQIQIYNSLNKEELLKRSSLLLYS